MNTRDKFVGVNSIKFYQRFVSEDECYQYLADIKWEKKHITKCKLQSGVGGFPCGGFPHRRSVLPDMNVLRNPLRNLRQPLPASERNDRATNSKDI